ncbi:hypothetical protein VFPFJ_07334 [Purpureocillium lilacinum]|uniref:Uncharacterized protein n=1 Tax=Purpureocillium lilacinum TaxID=33203 RepID=A0A179HHC4_PURLI|nr:hypothetical protein VFPFJ_07334 [Purpureocillium lilacinum]OAQ88869.1 hypothetical protein VFPFJ_07334 [Purpureocillium lilacinum]
MPPGKSLVTEPPGRVACSVALAVGLAADEGRVWGRRLKTLGRELVSRGLHWKMHPGVEAPCSNTPTLMQSLGADRRGMGRDSRVADLTTQQSRSVWPKGC